MAASLHRPMHRDAFFAPHENRSGGGSSADGAGADAELAAMHSVRHTPPRTDSREPLRTHAADHMDGSELGVATSPRRSREARRRDEAAARAKEAHAATAAATREAAATSSAAQTPAPTSAVAAAAAAAVNSVPPFLPLPAAFPSVSPPAPSPSAASAPALAMPAFVPSMPFGAGMMLPTPSAIQPLGSPLGGPFGMHAMRAAQAVPALSVQQTTSAKVLAVKPMLAFGGGGMHPMMNPMTMPFGVGGMMPVGMNPFASMQAMQNINAINMAFGNNQFSPAMVNPMFNFNANVAMLPANGAVKVEPSPSTAQASITPLPAPSTAAISPAPAPVVVVPSSRSSSSIPAFHSASHEFAAPSPTHANGNGSGMLSGHDLNDALGLSPRDHLHHTRRDNGLSADGVPLGPPLFTPRQSADAKDPKSAFGEFMRHDAFLDSAGGVELGLTPRASSSSLRLGVSRSGSSRDRDRKLNGHSRSASPSFLTSHSKLGRSSHSVSPVFGARADMESDLIPSSVGGQDGVETGPVDFIMKEEANGTPRGPAAERIGQRRNSNSHNGALESAAFSGRGLTTSVSFDESPLGMHRTLLGGSARMLSRTLAQGPGSNSESGSGSMSEVGSSTSLSGAHSRPITDTDDGEGEAEVAPQAGSIGLMPGLARTIELGERHDEDRVGGDMAVDDDRAAHSSESDASTDDEDCQDASTGRSASTVEANVRRTRSGVSLNSLPMDSSTASSATSSRKSKRVPSIRRRREESALVPRRGPSDSTSPTGLSSTDESWSKDKADLDAWPAKADKGKTTRSRTRGASEAASLPAVNEHSKGTATRSSNRTTRGQKKSDTAEHMDVEDEGKEDANRTSQPASGSAPQTMDTTETKIEPMQASAFHIAPPNAFGGAVSAHTLGHMNLLGNPLLMNPMPMPMPFGAFPPMFPPMQMPMQMGPGFPGSFGGGFIRPTQATIAKPVMAVVANTAPATDVGATAAATPHRPPLSSLSPSPPIATAAVSFDRSSCSLSPFNFFPSSWNLFGSAVKHTPAVVATAVTPFPQNNTPIAAAPFPLSGAVTSPSLPNTPFTSLQINTPAATHAQYPLASQPAPTHHTNNSGSLSSASPASVASPRASSEAKNARASCSRSCF